MAERVEDRDMTDIGLFVQQSDDRLMLLLGAVIAVFGTRIINSPRIFCMCRGGRYDVAKLLDFGLARLATDDQDLRLTRPGWLAGSPLYISPEQAPNDRAPNARGDVYSLGAVAYFLLTDHPPFECATLVDVLIGPCPGSGVAAVQTAGGRSGRSPAGRRPLPREGPAGTLSQRTGRYRSAFPMRGS
jgi:serine/threonine protein kinase